MFVNILKVFTVSFDEFNTYLLNEIISFLQTLVYVIISV